MVTDGPGVPAHHQKVLEIEAEQCKLEKIYPLENSDAALVSKGVSGRSSTEYVWVTLGNGKPYLSESFHAINSIFTPAKVRQEGNTLIAELGFDHGKKKLAVYALGVIKIKDEIVDNPEPLKEDDCKYAFEHAYLPCEKWDVSDSDGIKMNFSDEDWSKYRAVADNPSFNEAKLLEHCKTDNQSAGTMLKYEQFKEAICVPAAPEKK